MPLESSFDPQFHGTHENGYCRRTNIISTALPVPKAMERLLVDHNHDAIFGGRFEREMTSQEVAKLKVFAEGKGWIQADPNRHYYIVEAYRD
jgi:hypothetical protein